jgi:hypothetical protein
VSDGVVVVGEVVLGVVGTEGLVVAVEEGDPRLVVSPANESEAGAVWNWRTPTRPSAVPTMTKGARFIAFLQTLERKFLNMNSIGVHTQARKGNGNLISESRRATEIDVTLCDIWNQTSQDTCVKWGIFAWANDFVQSALMLIYQRLHFFVMNKILDL